MDFIDTIFGEITTMARDSAKSMKQLLPKDLLENASKVAAPEIAAREALKESKKKRIFFTQQPTFPGMLSQSEMQHQFAMQQRQATWQMYQGGFDPGAGLSRTATQERINYPGL